MKPQRIQVFSLVSPKDGTAKANRRYLVKWRVDGRDKTRSFRIKAEAERYRSRLIASVASGERFDPRTGLPASWNTVDITWWSWSRQWLGLKWPSWKGHSRKSGVEALVSITPHLVRSGAPTPPQTLSRWLWREGFRPTDMPTEGVELEWLDRWSLPLDLIDAGNLEDALTAATTRQDGQPARANVARRRRNLVGQVFKAAVRRGVLPTNPMERIEWSTPRRSVAVDVSVLPSVADVDELVRQVAALRSPGSRYAAFFAAIGFAGFRPSEVAGLRIEDLTLPTAGWGVAVLRRAIPSPGAGFTDGDGTRETKGLKHRAATDVRRVPLPSILVDRFRNHIERWPNDHGLVFLNAAGRSVTPENYGKIWNRERARLWPDGHRFGDTNPYDLRHTAATTMLRAGVPLPEAARRLGHSIEMLLRVYAGVFDDDLDRSNDLLDAEFGRQGILRP